MQDQDSSWRNRIVGHGEEPPDRLVPHPGNWRTHPKSQRDTLAGVLDDVGWVQDVVVNRRTGHLVDGHLRVELAADRREPSIPVVYVDLSEDEEALILATLDPISVMATADADALGSLLETVASSSAHVQALLQEVAAGAGIADEPAAGHTDPDELTALPVVPVSRVGDVWELGSHRLMCGDCTADDNVATLMAGESASWLWTDPPYGVGYVGRTGDELTIANDDETGLRELLRSAFAGADGVLADGAPIYVAQPSGSRSVLFGGSFLEAGWHLHQALVWVKDALVLGHSDYHYRHELIIYGWKGQSRPWFGGRDSDSVFEIARPRRSAEHPTVKPVELVEAHLLRSAPRGSLGYEPFAGSGTTLIAAERLGRRCSAMEIDPRYVDVAVRRWQEFTGSQATLAGDGRTFSELEEERDGG